MKGDVKIWGPQYQAECRTCGEMMDVWDSREEAEDQGREHDCLNRLMPWSTRVYREVLETTDDHVVLKLSLRGDPS